MNVQNTTRPTRIGAGATENAGAQYFFKAKIDDVAVWDEALTDAEIYALYNSGETLYAKENYGDYSSKDNLVAYYTMDSDKGLVQLCQMMKEVIMEVLMAHLHGVQIRLVQLRQLLHLP